MENKKTFRSVLYYARNHKGYSQDGLARHLGFSLQTIRNWERGRSKPRLTFADAKKVADFVDKSLDELAALQ